MPPSKVEFEVVDMVEAAMATGLKLPAVTLLDKDAFDRALPKGTVHQGIGIDCDPLADVYLPDIINRAAQKINRLWLCSIRWPTPHNLGAVIRSACAFGADAIIVQSRYAPFKRFGGQGCVRGDGAYFRSLWNQSGADDWSHAGKRIFCTCFGWAWRKTIGQAQKYNKTLLVLICRRSPVATVGAG